MRLGDRLECSDAVGSCLTDADEDAGGERDGEFARVLEGRKTALGGLVWSTTVTLEVVAQRLDHHPLRWRHGSQEREVVA